MLCACLFTTSGSVVLWSLSHSQKENFMRGVVVHNEHRIGYIVIRDQFGEFTVAELSGGYEVVKVTSSKEIFILKAMKPFIT